MDGRKRLLLLSAPEERKAKQQRPPPPLELQGEEKEGREEGCYRHDVTLSLSLTELARRVGRPTSASSSLSLSSQSLQVRSLFPSLPPPPHPPLHPRAPSLAHSPSLSASSPRTAAAVAAFVGASPPPPSSSPTRIFLTQPPISPPHRSSRLSPLPPAPIPILVSQADVPFLVVRARAWGCGGCLCLASWLPNSLQRRQWRRMEEQGKNKAAAVRDDGKWQRTDRLTD